MPASNQWPTIRERLVALEVQGAQLRLDISDPADGVKAQLSRLENKIDALMEDRAVRRPFLVAGRAVAMAVLGAAGAWLFELAKRGAIPPHS